jgi:hypothetical protein
MATNKKCDVKNLNIQRWMRLENLKDQSRRACRTSSAAFATHLRAYRWREYHVALA